VLTEAERVVTDRVRHDAVFFAREILGHDLWGVSEAVLHALSKPWARVAVRGCHASSKTFSAAEAVLWTPFAGGICVTTAPTASQVNQMVWSEVHIMYPQAKQPLGGELLKTAVFRIAPDLYALGRSTDKGVNFQGFHARKDGFMLIVLDEAPGVQPSVYHAIEGVRAGGDVRVLALGNPDVPSGPFYDAFTADRSGWETFTIDAFASPNFEDETNPGHYLTLEELLALPEERLAYAPRPYLITRRFVREKYDEWGVTSPLWASKVRGQFPDQAADSLISLEWIESAKRREIEPTDDDVWEAGIDVAGPGEDETVLVIRQGGAIETMCCWSTPDPRGEVLAVLAEYRDRLRMIKVDSAGLGHYFALHLVDNGYQGRVAFVNVGESPHDGEQYSNLKAELYWGLRMRFQAGEVAYLKDDVTISQLASIRYSHNARGQVVIERKEDARKRGVKSPDRAEALMLAFASRGQSAPATVGTTTSRWAGASPPSGPEIDTDASMGSGILMGQGGSRWRGGGNAG
jgi:phage terminase large subunit